MGIKRVFALRTASSLILGEWGLVVPLCYVQDCNLGQNKWKIQNKTSVPIPLKSSMEKWLIFALLEGLSLIGGGDGGLLLHFILSKIVSSSLVKEYLRTE